MARRPRPGWRPSVYFCLLPTGALILSAAFAFLGAERLLTYSIGGVPAIWPMVGFLSFVLFSVIRSHFNALVPDRLVMTCFAICGFAMVAFFAFLHRDAGLLCTAPTCPGTTQMAADDPAVTLPLGDAPRSSASIRWAETAPPPQPVDMLQIDRQFSSALYFSFVTFTTLGYGDFQPMPRMRLLAAIEAVLGYLYLGLLVGVLIDLGARRFRGPKSGAGRKTGAAHGTRKGGNENARNAKGRPAGRPDKS